MALREAGCRARIVLLEGFGDAAGLEVAARHSLEPFVHQPFQVGLLEAWRGPQQIRAWLKVDTGMHRLGFAAARRFRRRRRGSRPAGSSRNPSRS